MTVQEASRYISDKLKPVYGLGEAQAITRLMVEYLSGNANSNLASILGSDIKINNKKIVESIVNELLELKPVQYVLNEAWFWNLKFYVNEQVLIPRPETEELVKYIVDNYQGKLDATSILDIGSGSGCISIALKRELPKARIQSVDISNGALEVAKKNAQNLQADIDFVEMDFLQEHNWSQLGKFSIIVSNPPYIPLQEKEALDKNVTDWEPGTALFVPDNDPLLFYRKIALFGEKHLAENGNIFLECHQHYTQDTLQLFISQGYLAELKKDIFDNERMVRAWLSS
jgi:release factor glutamine methyltransferase